jgi:CRP-like cAMP-binding protein
LTAIASQDAEVTQFSADEFLKLIQNNPEFYFQASKILAAETDAAQTALAAMLSYWKITK